MNQLPYQVNVGGLVALLPDGRVTYMDQRAKPLFDAYNAGQRPPIEAFDRFVVDEPWVELNRFHLSAPVIAFIETTNLCNLRCTHCYASSGRKRPDEISTDVILGLLDEFDEMGVIQVFLTGGEVFSHPDVVEIINHARSKRFTTQVFTNGLLMTEDHLRAIPPGTSFFISFDTADPVRTARGGMDYPKLRRCFEMIAKHGHVVRTACSVHNRNIDDVEETFRWCARNGYPRPQWIETHPIGRALLHPDLLIRGEDVDRVFEIFKRCMDLFTERPEPELAVATLADGRRVRGLQTIKFCQNLQFATNREKCGRSMAYVSSAGDVYPCSNCMANQMYQAGNLRTQTFKEIWSAGFDEIRDITYDEWKVCARCPVAIDGFDCEFKCPPLAMNNSGDPRGCGASEYLRQFLHMTVQYWRERNEKGIKLTLMAPPSVHAELQGQHDA